MSNTAVIDSGPLIALFDQSDAHHERVCAYLKQNRGKLFTTAAVLTEVTHMLDFNSQVQIDFLKWVSAGALNLFEIQKPELIRITELTQKYADIPMDFADASLVVAAEKLKIKHVISLDHDFLIYRTLSGGYLVNLLKR